MKFQVLISAVLAFGLAKAYDPEENEDTVWLK